MIYRFIKRCMDLAGSLAGLALFSPVMLWTTWRIRREMGPPAVFSQMRAGRDGKPFRLYKFRSMTNERDANGDLLPDERRLTAFGKKLRATSIDELPQLWNVLKGDMSLVGPRPLLLQYVPLYNERERRRLDAQPGMTGWAQINGRNAISWPEKFALDLKIILLTIRKALKREGISAANDATMPAFTGSGEDDGTRGDAHGN